MSSPDDVDPLLDRGSLMKLGKPELITFILKQANNGEQWRVIGSQISDLTATIANLTSRLEKTEGELAVSANANNLLAERVNQLELRSIESERVMLNNGQYLRNKQVEVKMLPTAIADLPVPKLKEAMSGLLSLTGVAVNATDIGKCHKLGGGGKAVIMELHSRELRDQMLLSRKNLKNKSAEMSNMNMEGAMIVESMCKEFARLDFLCRSLKRRGEIAETWFFNGRLQLKITPNSRRVQVTHIEDLYNKFGRLNIDGLFSLSKRPVANDNED